MNPTLFNTMCMSLALSVAAASTTSAADIVAASGQQVSPTRAKAMSDFKATNTQSNFSNHIDGSIGRVYGKAFSTGPSTQISARNFINQHIDMWGLTTNELIEKGPFADGHHTQLIGYMPEVDAYKFTGHYYTQVKEGVPVFRSKLVLLVRNQENNPLVLASSQLYDLSNFQLGAQAINAPINQGRIIEVAAKAFNNAIVELDSTDRVIFAGVDTAPAAPRLADVSTVHINGFEKYLIVTDAATGEIIYQENLIHTVDISGNASALASDGPGSDNCELEVMQPLPYLSVGVVGGNSVFTDVNGDFTIPHGGTNAVTVDATLTGQWFSVTDNFNSAMSESVLATPPGPADLLFNSANASQNARAQVNAYIEANRVRDFVIAANPAYPQMQQNQFPIHVNQSGGLCPGNAWYDGSSINFCLSGGGSPNTAWSSVVHHEYGHHLVAVAGSGQGQYGEGMGDVMSTIILDDNRLGLGFFGSCNSSLRNADNNIQYPCGDAAHTCGQLISGCVWETREVLVVTQPANYTQILNFLAVNAILVHTGSTITPQITIDWLTLDDDDANIGNGTPHYAEIAAGFGAHNMDAPALTLVEITPIGLPDFVNPAGGTTIAAEFTNVAGVLDPSTPTLMVNTGSGFQPIAMTLAGGSTFEADFPTSTCGTQVSYYFTANDSNGLAQTSPVNAPASTYSTISATQAPLVAFDDNFESNQGWSVSGDSTSASTGRWERAIPTGAGVRADPATDFDGSGRAYITGNGGPDSNTDVDVDETILTSPVMDASGASVISYARWFNNAGNAAIDDRFYVQVSDNAGSTWTALETVGVNDPESNGGWFVKQFALSDVAGFTPNTQFRIRFIAEDIINGSIVEAGVDAVTLRVIDCSSCPADLTGDGILDFFDVSAFLSAFSAGNPSADFTGDGIFNFFDVSAFLSAFSAGCP